MKPNNDMKKKLMILILVALTCMSASAQVKFGAKVGLDLTNFWGKECGHHMVLNYQAGLLMEYKFHPHFGISPEVMFAAQGGQEKADDGSEMGGFIRSDKHYHTNYINVPVMLKYYPTQDFSIDFGPQVGFNVYSKYTKGKHEATEYKDMTKAVDFGLGLGCTCQWKLSILSTQRLPWAGSKTRHDREVPHLLLGAHPAGQERVPLCILSRLSILLWLCHA